MSSDRPEERRAASDERRAGVTTSTLRPRELAVLLVPVLALVLMVSAEAYAESRADRSSLNAERFIAPERNGANINIRLSVFFDKLRLRGIDLLRRERNIEIKNARTIDQALRMLETFENCAAIGAFALKHGGCVM